MAQEPFLGVNEGVITTHAWSNPLTSKQIHNSHLETLTAMCAKKFEFEFVRMEKSTGSHSAANIGTAAHKTVEDFIVNVYDPNVTIGNLVEEHWNKLVVPGLSPDTDELALNDLFQRNTIAAINWVAKNLDLKRTQNEKKFVIPRLSDLVSGISSEWSTSGSMDIVEFDFDKNTARVFDLKFRERSNEARNLASSQSIHYALALQYYGFQPEFSYLEVIKGQVHEQKIKLTNSKLMFHMERIRDAVHMLESGIYPMNSGSWWCSAKYCRFWKACAGKYEEV